MWAIVVKEFRQLRRDRRTVAMLFLLPFLFLVVFGYAASFDIKQIPTIVTGGFAQQAKAALPKQFDVVAVRRGDDRAAAEDALRRGEAVVAVVTPSDPSGPPVILIDGTELFAAQAALRDMATARAELASGGSPGAGGVVANGTGGAAANGAGGAAASGTGGTGPPVGFSPSGAAAILERVQLHVLFNPDLRTAVIMIPGLCGIILVFVGTVATALGVVRERQTGTMEQLAVMPFRPRDVFIGKIAPYLAIAAIDMVVIVLVGMWLFNVPFRGSVLTFALGSALFLFVTLGLGVLISTVSQTQGQAIQLAMMTMLPQFLLSGLFFPLYAMPWGVRWISYVLPLTYFVKIARGVMVRGAPIGALWFPMLMLALLGAVVFTASTLRFRRDLAPAARKQTPAPADEATADATA